MCDLAVMYFRLCIIYTYRSISSLCFDFGFLVMYLMCLRTTSHQ